MSGALDPARAPQFLDSMLRRNRIVLISATYCQFSTQLKKLFIEMKHRFVSLEVDIIPNGREVFQEAVARTGLHTVPQVFLNGKFLGGFDDIVALFKRGDLAAVLQSK